MESKLNFEQVSKEFDTKLVLDNISFEMPKNGCLWIRGENGSGKSTLLNLILDVHKITKGKILVWGMDSKKDSLKIKRICGVLNEANPLIEDITVWDYFSLVGQIYQKKNEVKEKGEKLLKIFFDQNPKELKDQIIKELSAGQKQKVRICIALINNPDIMVLDEPFISLDQNTIQLFIKILKEFADKLIILVTHSEKLGYQLATHQILLEKGRLIETDSFRQKSEIT